MNDTVKKMTREDRIAEIQKKLPDWSRKDIEESIEDISDEEIEKGYDIFDFDGTGMLEINKIDYLEAFENDEEAVNQAIKDGVKIIPVEELPENFDRKYLGWIDTPENRETIKKYCENLL